MMRALASPAFGPRALVLAATLAGGMLLAGGAPFTLRTAVLLVLAPLTEELVFRAGLQEGLLRRLRTPWIANALTALVFASLHVLVRGDAMAMAVAVPALLIGALYQRTRSLWPCIALHAAMNALWLAA